MNIESLIKKYFPTYKIYDASYKSDKQIKKIIEICLSVDNLIVFILRNDKNSNFFKTFETNHKLKENIGIMFFNKDNCRYFENKDIKEESIDGIIRYFKNFIEYNNNCCICYEEFDCEKRNTLLCGKCGSSYCTKCLLNIAVRNDNVVCPVCKSFVFLNHT